LKDETFKKEILSRAGKIAKDAKNAEEEILAIVESKL
jgi:hypothetical protein